MAPPTLFYAVEYVATLIDESIIAFTDRGIECLQDFLADIRSRAGGIHQFLVDAQCDPEILERIKAAGTRL
ncbi:hypothetical protein GA0061103_0625 [Rhizobium multihospitium]|uniref:Uncharacterized protein n=1 Tax=Rhizobium multihospitium TaxID=410764 RepID=A0A1C3XBQ7_9HYPH|nr:hypothetical protein GA0061103_0625 [Rhizobium multihospitium]